MDGGWWWLFFLGAGGVSYFLFQSRTHLFALQINGEKVGDSIRLLWLVSWMAFGMILGADHLQFAVRIIRVAGLLCPRLIGTFKISGFKNLRFQEFKISKLRFSRLPSLEY